MVFADFGLKVVKLTNSFQSRMRTQGGNINFFPENLQKPWILAKRKTTCLEKVTLIIFGSFGIHANEPMQS